MRGVGSALGGEAPEAFAGSPWAEAAAAALAHAPYLRRLILRRGDLLSALDEDWPDRQVHGALAVARAIGADPPPIEVAMAALRRAKDAVHLSVALADLARAWPLDRVTAALTAFADEAVRAALAVAAQEARARGYLHADGAKAGNPVPGFFLIAMGKMGACELNYSSDIDVSAFFDEEMFPAREPRVAAVRMVAPFVRVLEEITADGYVFRTDLRLRPDPGSTPVAVPLASAEHYYQSLGQNWERAAFIKARIVAGDISCGTEFLQSLTPFIWRKHLDFAAVEDVHAIKRQILTVHKSAELDEPAFNVKLGRGGIRDVELFAQTQQLVLGGRMPLLREKRTLAALEALAGIGAISTEEREALSEAYVFYREVEHRIQMLEDAQTHDVPADDEARARVAALCGFASLSAFNGALVERRRIVADIDNDLFARGESLADPAGSLIFTGVEDHPETLETLHKLGFADAAKVSETIRGWHHGRIRAMRSERSRELLTRLTPRLLRALSKTGDADQAFLGFASFFSELIAGVQLLSLLDARPALLDLLSRILTTAPRLTRMLVQRPGLLDAVIEPSFMAALAQGDANAYGAPLKERLDDANSFEVKLNIARRYHREEAFRIAVHLLDGLVEPLVAARAHADLADACVQAMASAALVETERQYGAEPGAFSVLGLGKLGGRELAAGSDLDLMVIYDAPAEAHGASEFYTRLTQRLITALSAPTEEGALYEVDTRLRPSGSQGPVAVRLSSFERYYFEDAWTWELQALTRMRPIAGAAALGQKASAIAREVLTRPCDEAKIFADVADMRARMERERRAKSAWDLKLAPGGLVDIEFAAQALQLAWAARAPEVVSANTADALDRLAAAGAVPASSHAALADALVLWSCLNQMLQACVGDHADPSAWPAPLQKLLPPLVGRADFAALETHVIALQQAARAAFTALVGAAPDANAPDSR
jgi:glutamate-ammonia-ligase adenylyltransferase